MCVSECDYPGKGLNGQRLNQEVTGRETLNRRQGPITG